MTTSYQSPPSTDISINELELSGIYQEQYNDIFPKINHINQDLFITTLENQVSLSLKINKKNFPSSLIQKVQNTFLKIYINDRTNVRNSIEKLHKINPKNLPYLQKPNFYIHCEKCNEALHYCGNSLIYFQNNIYCLSCEEVYKPYHLYLYCKEHNIYYYSAIKNIKNRKKKFLYKVQFNKVHCEKSKNNLMKCPNCDHNLCVNILKEKNCYDNLICSKCEKIYESNKLYFNCDICNKKFKSEPKIYINFDKTKIENLCIIHSIINNKFANPSIIISKNCNCDLEKNSKFKHNCGGILLDGNLLNKKVIVCNKCYEIFNYDKFQWNCPFCFQKIKTKVIRTCKSSYKNKNCFKNINEISSFSNKKSHERVNLNKNNFKRTLTNTSLRLFKKNIDTNESLLSKNNITNINFKTNIKLTDSKNEFKSNFTPLETKKMHNILFEFMNIKNGKNSFRSNQKTNKNNIITHFNVSNNDNSLNNNNLNHNNINNENNNRKNNIISNIIGNHSADKEIKEKEKEKSKENKIKINKIINLNNFSEINNKQIKQKFIGKNTNQMKFNINNKLEDFKSQLKTEIETSDNTSLKMNTNSKEKNSSSTKSGSNEKNSFSKTYFPANNVLEEENINNFNSDDYDIIKLIGEGTFGKIYSVEYPLNHHKFALKKISASSMEEINEKKKEYELLIKLNKENPNLNIVKIYGIQTKKLDKLTYVMYILMELADYDWEKEIKRRAKKKLYYNENELIIILKSLIETFSLLQSKGISHRDIKPQNILCFTNYNINDDNNNINDIKKDNNKNKNTNKNKINNKENNNIDSLDKKKNNIKFKIADFGEAKTKEKKILSEKNLEENQRDTNKQTLKGTELYMSPILFKAYRTYPYIGNIQYNAFKNDVFSLGLTFLFASTLTFQSLYDIREVYDMDILKNNVEKYLKGRYSKKFINCILLMLEINEKKRFDFCDLISWIYDNYGY